MEAATSEEVSALNEVNLIDIVYMHIKLTATWYFSILQTTVLWGNPQVFLKREVVT